MNAAATSATKTHLARARTRPLAGLGLLVVLLLLLPLAACAGGGGGAADGSGAESSTASAGGDADQAVGAAPQGQAADEEAGRSATRGRTGPMERAVVSTGEGSVRSDDVRRDRAEVLRLAGTWGAVVADEESGSDDDGRTAFSVLTLRVPTADFAAAMESLAGIGTLVDQRRSSEDVTTQVVDVGARVRAQERSVRRIEALLGEAGSLRDVITIEGDLAERRAELDSLRSQQAYLDDQTSLSTISMSIDAEERAPQRPDDDGVLGGFVDGLRDGWRALGASASVLLTVTGALLPFAVLAGLVAVPALAVVRRRRARPAAVADAG